MTRPTNARQRGVEEEDHPMRHELDTTRFGGLRGLCPEHPPLPSDSRQATQPLAACKYGDPDTKS
jgi:hypothetical protein